MWYVPVDEGAGGGSDDRFVEQPSSPIIQNKSSHQTLVAKRYPGRMLCPTQ